MMYSVHVNFVTYESNMTGLSTKLHSMINNCDRCCRRFVRIASKLSKKVEKTKQYSSFVLLVGQPQ